MKIDVNGTEHEVQSPTVSYESILALAGERPGASVVYSSRRKGDSQRAGTLYRGKSIEAEDGMRFTACQTGNA